VTEGLDGPGAADIDAQTFEAVTEIRVSG
jgi:hypothetical protein